MLRPLGYVVLLPYWLRGSWLAGTQNLTTEESPMTVSTIVRDNFPNDRGGRAEEGESIPDRSHVAMLVGGGGF